jgi:hypothetical protein
MGIGKHTKLDVYVVFGAEILRLGRLLTCCLCMFYVAIQVRLKTWGAFDGEIFPDK